MYSLSGENPQFSTLFLTNFSRNGDNRQNLHGKSLFKNGVPGRNHHGRRRRDCFRHRSRAGPSSRHPHARWRSRQHVRRCDRREFNDGGAGQLQIRQFHLVDLLQSRIERSAQDEIGKMLDDDGPDRSPNERPATGETNGRAKYSADRWLHDFHCRTTVPANLRRGMEPMSRRTVSERVQILPKSLVQDAR